MGDKDFIRIAKEVVVKYYNDTKEITDINEEITTDNVYIVWLCKTLQNNKALLSTTICDGMYYEVTYNGDKSEIYLDAYKKWQNKVYNTLGDKGKEAIIPINKLNKILRPIINEDI